MTKVCDALGETDADTVKLWVQHHCRFVTRGRCVFLVPFSWELWSGFLIHLDHSAESCLTCFCAAQYSKGPLQRQKAEGSAYRYMN